jgi:hypothetical protein
MIDPITDEEIPETIICNGCRNLQLWEEDIHPALVDYLQTMRVTKVVIARCDKIDIRLKLEWGEEHNEPVEVIWRPKVCFKHMKIPFSYNVQMSLPIGRGDIIPIT